MDSPPQTEVAGPVLDMSPFLSPNLGEGSERMKHCRHEDTCGDDDDGLPWSSRQEVVNVTTSNNRLGRAVVELFNLHIFSKLTTKEGNDEHKIIEDLSDKIPCPRATDDSGPEKLVTG